MQKAAHESRPKPLVIRKHQLPNPTASYILKKIKLENLIRQYIDEHKELLELTHFLVTMQMLPLL